MYKHMIPIMATVRKWRGKIWLAFLFRVSLYAFTDLGNENCLNEYFVSIPTVVDTTATLPPFFCRTQNSIHIEESEMVDVIQTLNVNKASGDDHMVLKHTCQSIKKPLSILFNISLHECKFSLLGNSD